MTKTFGGCNAVELFGRSFFPVFHFDGGFLIQFDNYVLLEGIVIGRLKLNAFNSDGMCIVPVKTKSQKYNT